MPLNKETKPSIISNVVKPNFLVSSNKSYSVNQVQTLLHFSELFKVNFHPFTVTIQIYNTQDMDI